MKDSKFYEYITAYGIAHGLLTALFIYLAWRFAHTLIVPVAVISTVYYYVREAKARGTYDIRQWYKDSQWDAITPALVASLGIYLIYFR